MTTLIAFKLLLTPLLIAAATVVARRWGTGVAGWLAGLPLTSGPVSVFLVLEQGGSFTEQAAIGTLFGLVGIAAFCLAYALAAQDRQWAPAAAAGLLAFFAVGWLVRSLFLPAGAALAFACGSLLVALRFIPWSESIVGIASPSRWDIPVRVVAATGLVLLLTAVARALGPQLTGILSPFPIYAGILAVFSHHTIGAAAAQQLLRGTLIGCFGFASFFFIVASFLTRLGLIQTYTIASLAALAINGVLLVMLVRPFAASSRRL